MRTLLIESYYLWNDRANVMSLLKPTVDAQARAGRAPDESQLQLLGTCAQRSNDSGTYRDTLEKLVAFHPKQLYWDDLFAAIRSKPGYSSSLDIDTNRLRRATGSLTTADDYIQMTQLPLVEGTSAEGKQVIDQGFSSGVLGHDADAEREKRLQALATKRATSTVDSNGMPILPFDLAFNQVFAGQARHGLATMEGLIAKGGVTHPDQAQLHLGEAYFFAGQKQKAIQTFKAVKGDDGSADLARLWVLVALK
jgi:hypothetical protein